jgi:hypothetical protein
MTSPKGELGSKKATDDPNRKETFLPCITAGSGADEQTTLAKERRWGKTGETRERVEGT